MDNNQTIQQIKFDPKGKAIASLIIGTINIALSVVMVVALREIMLILPLGALAGIILGMLGLKSTKRNFAIGGIILSFISFFILIPFYLVILREIY